MSFINNFDIDKLQNKYNILICGIRATGKTWLTKKIIENQINKKDNIYIFESPKTDCYSDLSQYNNIHIIKCTNSDLLQNNNSQNLIVFDLLSGSSSKTYDSFSDLLSEQFVKNNLSFILNYQHFNNNNVIMKNNIDYIFLFNYDESIYNNYFSEYMNIDDFKNLFNNNNYYRCLVIDVKSNNINDKLFWYKA